MLKPTQRIKQRYVLFRVIPNKYTEEDVHRMIYSSLRSLYGDVGVYPLGYKLISFHSDTGYGIVRFSRKHLYRGIAALVMITRYQDEKVRVRSISTSGTLKKLRERLNRYLDASESNFIPNS